MKFSGPGAKIPNWDMTMPEEVSIVVCGPAGQGIKIVESLLAATVKAAGFRVFTAKEYMSRVRGGINSTQVLVSSRRLRSPLDRIDVLVAFGPGGID